MIAGKVRTIPRSASISGQLPTLNLKAIAWASLSEEVVTNG